MNWQELVYAFLLWQIPLSLAAGGVYGLTRLGHPWSRLWCARILWLCALVVPPICALSLGMEQEGASGPLFVADAQGGAVKMVQAATSYVSPRPEATPAQAHFSTVVLAILGGLILLLSTVRALSLFRGERILRRIYRDAKAWRDFKALEIRISEEIPGPVALHLARRRIVLLDPETAGDPALRKIALMHEIQHHRQADPRCTRVFAWIGALFVVNPITWGVLRWFESLEEQACDHEVLARNRMDPRKYCLALLQVAGRGLELGRPALATSGRAMAQRKSLLKLRTQNIMNPNKGTHRRALLIAGIGAGALLGSSWTVAKVSAQVSSSSLNLSQYLGKMSPDGLFLPDTPLIRDQIRRILSRPKTLNWIREGILRYRREGAYVEQQIVKAGLPRALRAVPLIESAYDPEQTTSPRPPEMNLKWTRGLWQFIPSTAREYGLVVSEKLDERADVEKSTAAALHLLSDLYREFQDWPLAFAAYNQGAQKVRKACAQGKSRDLSTLVEKGLLGRYSPALISIVLFLNHPELLGLERG